MKNGPYSVKQYPIELRDAARRCFQHRYVAEKRGIEWKFTFEEWWKLWQDSGHWAERGLGAKKYCMCRYGDKGPYAVGNVFIATNSENSLAVDRSHQRYKRRVERKVQKTLPQGVRTQAGKYCATRKVKGVSHHLGTFLTPELASAAYQSFTA